MDNDVEIQRLLAARTSALAHVVDQKGRDNYVLWLNRIGVVWSIWIMWDLSADKVKDCFSDFLKGYAQAKAKEARPDDAVSEARR